MTVQSWCNVAAAVQSDLSDDVANGDDTYATVNAKRTVSKGLSSAIDGDNSPTTSVHAGRGRLNR